jgi:hypothetical protein
MKTHVMCRDKDATYDFTDCKTERVDTAASLARVVCDPGYVAISGGGYCSNQDALRQWWVYSDLSGSGTTCDNADMIHGYAICCRRRLDDPR